MNYQFPVITNISQVLPLIADKPEFIVAVKDGGYTVVNYVVMAGDTFPEVENEGHAILRELRGLIFETATGNVLQRRYHKFFNCNERTETQVGKIDFNEPHVILEKLDGSMITPVQTTDGLRWGTKMGVTQVALPVEEFVADRIEYVNMAEFLSTKDMTPIFEWCSRQQAIVIDYPEDMLVLTAVRDNKTGDYMSYKDMVFLAKCFAIPVVKAYAGSANNMQALVDETKELVGAEGFVVRFDSGHMIKVKAEDYLRKHKTKDAIQREKNVISLLVNEQADDVKAFMDPKDLERFEKFENLFWLGVRETALDLNALHYVAASFNMLDDKKKYAVEFVQKQPEKYSRFLYKMFIPCNTFNLVKEAIAASVGTQAKIDECRWMFGNVKWNEEIVEE